VDETITSNGMRRATASLKYTLPHSIVGDGEGMEKAVLRKAALAGLVAALAVAAVAIAYPVAAWALYMGRYASTSSGEAGSGVETPTISTEDSDDYAYQVLGKGLAIYGEKEHWRGHHIQPSLPKVVLSAALNVTSSSVQNVSAGDKVGLVLTKKGGNYSLLMIVWTKVVQGNHTRHKVYQLSTNSTNVSIGSDSITITGTIARSNLQGFTPGSQITVVVKIGTATITSGSSSIAGDVIGLIFRR